MVGDLVDRLVRGMDMVVDVVWPAVAGGPGCRQIEDVVDDMASTPSVGSTGEELSIPRRYTCDPLGARRTASAVAPREARQPFAPRWRPPGMTHARPRSPATSRPSRTAPTWAYAPLTPSYASALTGASPTTTTLKVARLSPQPEARRGARGPAHADVVLPVLLSLLTSTDTDSVRGRGSLAGGAGRGRRRGLCRVRDTVVVRQVACGEEFGVHSVVFRPSR